MGSISRNLLDSMTSAVNLLSLDSDKDVRSAVKTCIKVIGKDDISALREKLIETCLPLAKDYAVASAVLGSSFYDACRRNLIGSAIGAKPVSIYSESVGESSVDAFSGAIRAFVDVVGKDGWETILENKVAERVNYELRKSCSYAMTQAAVFEKEKNGNEVRFARIPSGSETCVFCLMMASRGYAYTSAHAAGELNHYHSNCDCRVVPSWSAKRSFLTKKPQRLGTN